MISLSVLEPFVWSKWLSCMTRCSALGLEVPWWWTCWRYPRWGFLTWLMVLGEPTTLLLTHGCHFFPPATASCPHAAKSWVMSALVLPQRDATQTASFTGSRLGDTETTHAGTSWFPTQWFFYRKRVWMEKLARGWEIPDGSERSQPAPWSGLALGYAWDAPWSPAHARWCHCQEVATRAMRGSTAPVTLPALPGCALYLWEDEQNTTGKETHLWSFMGLCMGKAGSFMTEEYCEILPNHLLEYQH